MKDELAGRRAAKGVVTIKVGDAVRHVQLAPADTIDPAATLKARSRRKPLKPT